MNAKDTNSGTPLSIACRFGHLNIVKFLIKNGADASIKSRHGTPLEQAQEFKHDDVVAFLKAHEGASN